MGGNLRFQWCPCISIDFSCDHDLSFLSFLSFTHVISRLVVWLACFYSIGKSNCPWDLLAKQCTYASEQSFPIFDVIHKSAKKFRFSFSHRRLATCASSVTNCTLHLRDPVFEPFPSPLLLYIQSCTTSHSVFRSCPVFNYRSLAGSSPSSLGYATFLSH